MEKLKCSNCGNTKYFYKEVHLIAKVNVSSSGKRGKRLYDTYEDEDFKSLRCRECGNIVKECFYCN